MPPRVGDVVPVATRAGDTASPRGLEAPELPAEGSAGPPIATNSWARRRILDSAQELDLAPPVAKHVGSVATWYYNRIVLVLNRKDAPSQELPYSTNRYLVPITLALACEYKRLGIGLDRLLLLSGTPSKKTVANAHAFLALYRRMLVNRGTAVAPRTAPRTPRPTAAAAANAGPTRPAPTPRYNSRSPPVARPRGATPRPSVAPGAPPGGPNVALALPAAGEVLRVRQQFGPAGAKGPKSAAKPRQQNTNAWARKRIAELSASLVLPENVRKRSAALYERVVDFHTKTSGLPPGQRLQLSPRLNWSLVYTTVYLGCRVEEYPIDLRDILGGHPKEGIIQEIYRQYRLYKRELNLTVKLVDVRTFILSWLDGFELTGLLHDHATNRESEKVKNRAFAIAQKAQRDLGLASTSTKVIAAGALTTALAERDPPGNLRAFYRAVADVLHLSEETIRAIVKRIAMIL